jgi:Phage portal protein
VVSMFDRFANGANRLAHAWNAFINTPDNVPATRSFGGFSNSGMNPSRTRLVATGDRSIISSIYTRISIDFAAVSLEHVYLDPNKHYLRDAISGLQNCLTLQANIDQGARAFRQDIAMSLFDKGAIAIVPVDTSDAPLRSGSYDIRTMRVGEIINWYPRFVRVRVYNDNKGMREEITLPKSVVAIVENPLYSVMNEPNGTLQRLLRKLNLLDTIDEASSSGKLDLIIQLPYVVKDQTRKDQAEARARDIENQLKNSKYGVAYTDGTEKITQLNRPVENNMLAQIELLTGMLYSQLGLSPTVFDGTADEKTMLNYYNRTIEPILGAVQESMKGTFLTKTALSQGQSIEYYRDPFKLLTIDDLGNVVDKLSRNEILTGNEIRALIGFKPSSDPNADKLLNKNLPVQAQPAGGAIAAPTQAPVDLGEVPNTPVGARPASPQPLAITAGAPAPTPQSAVMDQTLAALDAKIKTIAAGVGVKR